MEEEFKSFDEITRLYTNVTITEKIHGTNAHIHIADLPHTGPLASLCRPASRERYINPDADNYGFARRVYEQQRELIELLGPGRHFGEWYGNGINSGYGLKEKRFALFNTHRWGPAKLDGKLLPWMDVVPVLYQGPWKDGIVLEVMAKLKESGSQIAPGFMIPEGVVIRFDRNGAMFKHVFEAEESAWKGIPRKDKPPKPQADLEAVATWLQPLRFEKLLSRDERYQREYPATLAVMAKAYMADMEKEEQLKNLDDPTLAALKKAVFPWIKLQMAERGYSA